MAKNRATAWIRFELTSTYQNIHMYIGSGTSQVAPNLICCKKSLLANVVSGATMDVLHVVKCNCKTDRHFARCACRKSGFIICTVGCWGYRGESSMNSLSKILPEAAVNMNDDSRKQWLKVETIACVCLKCVRFFIGQAIFINLLLLSNLVCWPATEARFSVSRAWLGTWHLDHQYSISLHVLWWYQISSILLLSLVFLNVFLKFLSPKCKHNTCMSRNYTDIAPFFYLFRS